ncbi:hypothetical protein WMF45_13530 [Sorangium sp. So ce448]|uniref:hypothetical protein n=1 Tax=Sorangium sp. So ce448 TaxID=3133314 RepID=UPI003F5EAFF0
MNRNQRRAAKAQSGAKGTPATADAKRMSLMQRHEDEIRRSHEAARSTHGDDVVVVVADPSDPLGRIVSSRVKSDAELDALIASGARNGQRPTVIFTTSRDDFAQLAEERAPLIARDLRAWSPDTGRILVMCFAAGGIKVAELGTGYEAGAQRLRAEILQQSEYGIYRAREESVEAGKADVVVLVADVRDPTGRSVALSSGETTASIEAMIASAAAKRGLPVLIVGKQRDVVTRAVQKNLPHLVAILENWWPKGGEFPVICFASGGETVAMLPDIKLAPPGSA